MGNGTQHGIMFGEYVPPPVTDLRWLFSGSPRLPFLRVFGQLNLRTRQNYIDIPLYEFDAELFCRILDECDKR